MAKIIEPAGAYNGVLGTPTPRNTRAPMFYNLSELSDPENVGVVPFRAANSDYSEHGMISLRSRG